MRKWLRSEAVLLALFATTIGCHRTVRANTADLPAPEDRLSQVQLQADARQLVGYLESAHPDPYGDRGKVAFHRDVREILDAIGPEGMTVEEFFQLVRPLVASLGDGHTTIRMRRGPGDDARAWLDLEPTDGTLVVSRIYREEDRQLLGGAVESIDGVHLTEIRERMGKIRGTENIYTELLYVAEALQDAGTLGDLLEWENRPRSLSVRVRGIDGIIQGEVPFGAPPAGEGFSPPSQVALPEPNAAGMAWEFLVEDDSVAYLRIDTMMRYREAFEIWRETGYTSNLGSHLTDVASAATNGPEPEGIDERIESVPSGTELFTELFTAMKESETEHLIVDLRRNQGGQSYLSLVLAYFLFGMDELEQLDNGYQIRRYSQLFLDNYESRSAASLRGEGFELGDYDFSDEREWFRRQSGGLTSEERQARRTNLEETLRYAPTVRRIIEQGSWDGYWTPQVTVLTSARTFSAGFDVAVTLHKLGAQIAGVPPSQAGNCYIDTLGYALDHTGLSGGLSYKRSLLFPDNPQKGTMLRPDLELTLADLESMEFDPNATVRMVLTVVQPPRTESL
jgi:hypothetical protein